MPKRIAVLFVLAVALTSAIQAQPAITGIANTLSGQPSFSPGSLVSIYGSNLMVSGSTTTVSVGSQAAAVITQDSVPAQLAVQLPFNLATGPTTLTVTAGGQTSAPANLTIAAYAPALDTANGSGTGLGLFISLAGTQYSTTNPITPGATVTALATGLGAVNPAVAAGAVPSGVTNTVAPVTATVGGEAATVAFAGEVPSVYDGIYQVNITIPKDASVCGTNVVLTVGGISSPPVTAPIATTPQPILCSIENSATGLVRDATHGAAAGSLISIYAGSLGATNAGNLYPAATVQGIQADFNGTPLPLYTLINLPPYLGLINTALPSNTGSSGTGVVTVKNSAGASQSYTIELAPADVGVFRLPGPNAPNQGVVLLTTAYAFAMPAAVAASYGLPACAGLPITTPCGQPALAGSKIVIYYTGGGLATPGGDPNGAPLALGSVAPVDGSVLYKTVLQPTVSIGGLPATVDFSGIAPGTAAEYQLNTTIPAGVTAGSNVPVMITMGSSNDTVTIAVASQ